MSENISFDSNASEDLQVSVLTSAYEEPARIMNVKFTSEGVIIDFYDDAELTATMGMTYEEWFDFCDARSRR